MIDEATRELVIVMWLTGKSRAEIAGQLDISEGSVSAIVNEFISQFGKDAKTAKRLIDAMRKSKLSVKEHALAVRLLHIMIRHVNTGNPDDPADVKQLEAATELLEKYIEASMSARLHPAKALEISKKIEALSTHLDVPAEELLNAIEARRDELSQLSREVVLSRREAEDAKIERDEASRQRDEAIRSRDFTLQQLEECSRLKALLAGSGLSPAIIPDVAALLMELKVNKIDIQSVIPAVKSISDMQTEKEHKKLELLHQFETHQQIIKGYDNQIAWRANLVRTADRRAQMGIDSRMDASLLDAIEAFASAQGTSSAGVYQTLVEALIKAAEVVKAEKAVSTSGITTAVNAIATTTTKPASVTPSSAAVASSPYLGGKSKDKVIVPQVVENTLHKAASTHPTPSEMQDAAGQALAKTSVPIDRTHAEQEKYFNPDDKGETITSKSGAHFIMKRSGQTTMISGQVFSGSGKTIQSGSYS